MGVVIIMAILATFTIANRYGEPEVSAVVVLSLTAFLLVVGNMIIKAFERVALTSLSKSEFISIMSHQLRSPLSAIKWQLNILMSANPKINKGIPDEALGYFDRINEYNERMIKSVNDLLVVNRIEDKDLLLRATEWDLTDLTERICENYRQFGFAHNVSVEITHEGDTKVFADEEQIKLAIEHMLDNAIRYSLKGGRVDVHISENCGVDVLWKVADNGIGMTTEDQKRVFDKFFRSKDITLYQTEGSGVGLFIVKSIIELSGGDVGFSSEEKKGSIFWFTLPTQKGITSKNKKIMK